MIERMTRAELVRAVAAIEPIVSEWYVDSDETDDHPCHSNAWCFEHAEQVARIEALLVGAEMHAANAWTEDDRFARCDWYGCGVALRAGGLTSHAIDDVIGLTERKPLECGVEPAALALAGQSMRHDDPRWALWEHHARRFVSAESAR